MLFRSSARTGRVIPGATGLALAMIVAALVLFPVGVAAAGADLLDPWVLAMGAVVALLSSAIPYSAEFEALRMIPEHVFGVLLSLMPAAAALAGLLVLGPELAARELIGIAAVVVASAGAASRATAPALTAVG